MHHEPRGANAERARRRPPDVSAFVKELGLSGTIHTGANATDYWFLDRYIRKHRPARVLELGGGVTTYVMARAMKQIGYGQLVSIEHVRKYHNATRDLLPSDLRNHVELVYTSQVGDMFNGRPVLRYDEIPPDHYDMIFCDYMDAIGGTFGTYFPHVDPLLALDERPTDIITDRKLYSLNHYARWLACDVRYGPVLGIGFVHGVTARDVVPSRHRLKIGNVIKEFGIA